MFRNKFLASSKHPMPCSSISPLKGKQQETICKRAQYETMRACGLHRRTSNLSSRLIPSHIFFVSPENGLVFFLNIDGGLDHAFQEADDELVRVAKCVHAVHRRLSPACTQTLRENAFYNSMIRKHWAGTATHRLKNKRESDAAAVVLRAKIKIHRLID